MAVDALARALAAGKVPVSAYEMAVKAGYTGTEEQFAEDMGNSGTNAANAAASASAAAASAESISASAAQIATNTSDISDLKTHIDENGLTATNISPVMSQGEITLSSGALAYSASTTSCVTPNGSVIIAEPGTMIKLLDKSVYKIRYWYSGGGAWYSGGSYSANDITSPKQRLYVIQIARQDGGTITATEATNAVRIVHPMSVGDMRDLGFYKTFSIADQFTKNGDLPGSLNGLATETTASHITGFIPVFAGQVVSYRLKSSVNYYVMALYDADGNFTEGILAASGAVEGTYTITANGFMRVSCLVAFTDAYLYFSGYSIPDAVQVIADNLNNEISSVGAKTDEIKATLVPISSAIDGKIDVSGIFESGSIFMNTEGWTYEDNQKRVRVQQGSEIWLSPGDTIKMSSYTNTRFIVGWRTASGTYGVTQWQQNDYIVKTAGYYTIVAGYYPEVTISDADSIVRMLSVNKCANLINKAALSAQTIYGVNHRGYNLIAPENTMPAFKLSKEMGFGWVETDISFTSDNVPVLLHDDTIDRTSDGTGTISSMTYAQVEGYDFGSWKSAEYTGTKIPTLAELLDFCKKNGMCAYLELKSFGSSEANVKACAKLVQEYGLENKMVWISFGAVFLEYIRDVIPTATLGYVVSTLNANAIATASGLLNGKNAVFISAPPSQFTSENIDAMIAEGISGNAYTVNTLAAVVDASSFVKSITTDCVTVPEALLSSALF